METTVQKNLYQTLFWKCYITLVSTVYFEGARESTDEFLDDKKRYRNLVPVRMSHIGGYILNTIVFQTSQFYQKPCKYM